MTTSIPINQAKADLFRTLGHPVRIRVLEMLVARPTSVRDLLAEIGIESSSLSQQLAVLRRAGWSPRPARAPWWSTRSPRTPSRTSSWRAAAFSTRCGATPRVCSPNCAAPPDFAEPDRVGYSLPVLAHHGERWAPVAQRIEHLTTDQKVWGSNPYRRTDRIHRMTCANAWTRAASHQGVGPFPSQKPAQKLPAGWLSPGVVCGRDREQRPPEIGPRPPHVPPFR